MVDPKAPSVGSKRSEIQNEIAANVSSVCKMQLNSQLCKRGFTEKTMMTAPHNTMTKHRSRSNSTRRVHSIPKGQSFKHHHQYEPRTPSTASHLHTLLIDRFHDQAIRHLNANPNESRIWISLQDYHVSSTRNTSSRECEYNLPLHYVCRATSTNSISGGDIHLPLLQTLIQQYPNAARQYNSKGHLPLHLACQCVSFTHNPSLAESAIMILINAHPHGLLCKNKEGKRPIDLLVENGVDCKRGGNVLRFVKSKMTEMKDERGLVETEFQLSPRKDAREDCESRRDGKKNFALDDFQTTRYFRDDVNESRDDDCVLDYYPIETPRHDNRQKSYQFDRESCITTTTHDRDNNEYEMTERRDDNHFLYHQMEILSDDTPRHANRRISQPQHFVDGFVDTRTINEYSHYSETELNNRCNSKQRRRRRASPTSSSQLNLNSPIDASSQEYYSNHAPIVTPANNEMSTPKSTEYYSNSPHSTNNPFHHLEQELRAMKASHESISNLLNVNVTNERNLQSQLNQLQESYNTLKLQYDTLSTKYSKAMEQSKDMDRHLADKNHELQVMKTKEDAISFELTARLRTNEEQQCKLIELTDRLKEEERNRVSTEKELIEERKVNSKLMEMNEEMTRSNNDMVKQLADAAVEKQSLLQEMEILKQEVTAKDKLLADLATKETYMCNQLMQKLSLLDSTGNESREKDVMLKKEQETNRILERDLLAAQKTEASNAKLVKAAEKKSLEVQTLLGEEQSKNIQLEKDLAVMRDKVEAAKVGLAYLQHRKANPKDDETAVNRIKLNEDAANKQKENKNSALSSKESLKLLSPVIQDVLQSQQNTIQKARQLVQEATASKHLMGQISDISSQKFSFQSTLQLLESILTTHIKTMKGLDAAVGFERSCKSKLSSLFDVPLQTKDLNAVLVTDDKTLQHERYKKLAAATENHVKKIENLHKMALELQTIKVDDTSNNDDTKHILVANEMTSIFQQTMATLLHDAKQLNDSDTNTNFK